MADSPCIEHGEKLATTVQAVEQHERRITLLEKHYKILAEMSTNLTVLATQIKNQGKDITAIKDELTTLRNIPTKRWNTVVTTIITVIITAGVTTLLAVLLNK